ncbi:response regulator [Nocardioides sp.]|uniref:response regulator n=1 Tax=Nocardioides sp. TaxID=35761 RepID=UPI002D7FF37D|nr:response regulator [Nocardioides sp.]HET8961091.1 response regulator [Nocardioides sp.]
MTLSVLVVEDRPEIARVLTYLVESDDRLSLAGVATDGAEALALTEQHRPDAIVCDLHMPRMDGLEAVPQLRESCPDGVIVMYSSDPHTANAARALGADAVVDKADDPAGLFELLVRLSASRRRTTAAGIVPSA